MTRIFRGGLYLIDEYFEKELRQVLSRHTLQPLPESDFCLIMVQHIIFKGGKKSSVSRTKIETFLVYFKSMKLNMQGGVQKSTKLLRQ